MRLITTWSVLAMTALLLASCGSGTNPAGSPGTASLVRSDAPRATADAGAGQEGAAAIEAFGADLYGVLAREEGNLVFSPYSAIVALAMTRAGATGETAAQMDAVLHADLAGDIHAGLNALEQALAQRPGTYEIGDGVTAELELATANQLWGQDGFAFEQAFLDQLASNYGAGMRLLDYREDEAREAARAAINQWVSEQTGERIPELIPDGVLNELTRLVLTNAIYLKAPWLFTFDEEATAPAPFHLLDGSETQVDMMAVEARTFYGSGPGYQAVELPYIGQALSMIVIVPDEGEFAAFEDGLDGARLREVIDSLGDTMVTLRLPRFEFRTQAMLKDALSELGMPIAFTEDADFSGMSPEGRDLEIAEVVHEAFIAVDEAGTEAAAATAVIDQVTSAPPVAELTVDRPFLFLIRDRETGAILFMGRVVNPAE